MSVRSMVCRLGCACAALVVLVGCARQGGATTNRPAPAANVAGVTAALPDSPPANTSQNDLFPIDNAAANATNTVDPAQASLLAEKNADCVDQLIKAQPFGESRSQIIGNVTKACLPIAKMATQGSTEPPASIEASERRFVAGRVHDLAADTNAAAANSSSPGG